MKKVKVISAIILPVLLITGILAVSGHADKPDSPPGLSKKKPKPEPIKVSITGAIVGVDEEYEEYEDGTGNPATMAIHFSEAFGAEATLGSDGNPRTYPCIYTHDPCIESTCDGASHHEGECSGRDVLLYGLYGPHVQNPDRENPLRISGIPRNKNFSFRYCDHHEHTDTTTKCTSYDVDGPDNNNNKLDNHSPKYYKELDIYGGILDKKTGKIVWPAGSDWRISWKQIMGTIITGTLDQDVTYEVLKWSE